MSNYRSNVATEFKSNNLELHYYKKASEVDFIIYLENEIISVEVK